MWLHWDEGVLPGTIVDYFEDLNPQIFNWTHKLCILIIEQWLMFLDKEGSNTNFAGLNPKMFKIRWDQILYIHHVTIGSIVAGLGHKAI